MRCEQARQLFDAYLDEELSPTMATEFGAHRLRCPECRQALALLEVSGHIMQTDPESVQLHHSFTERLIACMSDRPERWGPRVKRALYVGGPLAAAAVIALAFLGVFDRQAEKVAGTKEVLIERADATAPPSTAGVPAHDGTADRGSSAREGSQASLEEWLERAQQNINSKRESGDVLRQYFDQTVADWSDIIDHAKDGATASEPHPTSDAPTLPANSDDASSADDSSENG